ncbi:MAG: porin family protein [Muribaculaceae bacterium]|nr:porin family protein [Muribaculaceae bacterium]
MKKIILACMAACVAFAGSAQIIRSTTSERSMSFQSEPAAEKQFSNYAVLALSYDHTSFSFNKEAGGSDYNFGTNGIGFNFIKGYNVSRKLPLYIEWGLNMSYGQSSDSEVQGKAKVTEKNRFLSFGLPVNLAYRHGITDKLFVKPYLGINFRVTALGDNRIDAEYDGETMTGNGYGEWESVFDSEEGYESHWNRFQMGWQIGASIEYSALYFGLQYGTDFIPAFSYESAKVNTGMFRLLLGVSF